MESRKDRQAEIILLHDGGHLAFGTDRHFTVEATRVLLQKYPSKQFLRVDELLV
jgi:hypothetical protein